MLLFRPLPWEFAVRNLFRRPLRSALTFVGLTTVIVLVLVTVGFIRGLEKSLSESGNPNVAIVFALGMGENLEYSSIPARTADLLSASLEGIRRRYGRNYASAELYLATIIGCGEGKEPTMGLVRGVTPAALLVRQQVQILQGQWPGPGEVLVGRLAAAKLGAREEELAVGQTIELEGRSWRVSGRFAASGSVFGSEIWCRLDDLQQALKRQDLSLVAVTLRPDADFAEVDLFCKERLDLELQAIREADYFASLHEDYRPVRMLAWLVAALVAGAGVFAGLNTMYGAVMGRTGELAALQTIGFARRAVLLSLVQEGLVLAVGASVAAALVAILAVNGVAVRFTMGAFELRIDSVAVLAGLATGLLLGLIGAVPPALRALRMPVVDGLRAV
ncbi:MAG: ABC transporter permease [Planctomycetes bacterium]|nr:ABC transporter permease [Planctomycetota bacterium]